MKLNGVSVCTAEKGKERTMPICKTDTTDVDSFTVVRHEVERWYAQILRRRQASP